MIYLSVFITNYNRNQLCIKAIESVLGQTYPYLECIVIDDASTDDSVALIEQISNPRLHLIKLLTNCGQARALNQYVPKAKHSWIAFLDSDDYWHPQRLELQVAQIQQYGTSYGLYYCASYIEYPDGFRRLVPALHEGQVGIAMKFENLVGITSRIIVHKDLYEAIGGMDTALPTCKDWDCWLRIAQQAPVKPLNVPLVYYTEATDSVSSNLEKIITGRTRFWQKHFGDRIEPTVKAQLMLTFVRFLLSRGFQKAARQYAFQAVRLSSSPTALGYWIATFLPSKWLIQFYGWRARSKSSEATQYPISQRFLSSGRTTSET